MTETSTLHHAVILAAGLGSRLRPYTDERPKPLVPVHGIPILHNTLANLADVGITQATIVVGYRKEAIQRSCGTRFGGIDIAYVESSVFDRTGSAFSLWLARAALLGGDALLLEGDVFFDEETLPALLAVVGDVAAVAPFDATMTGSAVTLSASGAVSSFRMNQTSEALRDGAPLYKTMNLFHFTAETSRRILVPALDAMIEGGATRAYVEQVLANLVNEGSLTLTAVPCGECKWFEIDSEADLRAAEAIFADAAFVPA